MADHRQEGPRHLDEVFWVESDESLAARAASDPLALAELYNRYLPRVDRYCRHKLHEEDLVEDIAAQIFLKVIEGIRKQPVTHVRSWIFAIAHNEVVNAYRRRRPQAQLDNLLNLESTDPSPEEAAIAHGLERQLRDLLPRLSGNEQRLVELRLFGMTNQEICEVMHKSPPWVRTTQHRAYRHLRTMLNEQSASEGR